MKFVEKMKRIELDWILMSLAISAIVSIIFFGLEMKPNFTMPWLAIHIGIVVAVFAAVLVGGSLLERKIISRFQNETKG